MKTRGYLILLLPLLFPIQRTCGQVNLKLSRQIDSLYAVDQNAQLQIKKALEAKVRFDSIQKLQDIEQKIFSGHIPIIKEIIALHGYPSKNMVGKESFGHFFILIQHADADPEFQSSILGILEKLAAQDEIEKKQYAYLYDRVQRNTGKMQLYGTQLSFDSKGNLFDSNDKIIIPTDLADPENVDKRRNQMGLEPLEQYYQKALKELGRPSKRD
ncbi:MAG TPA: DUF6624 domain-containing protein [Chryseosolibacter sp.]|nr:DUF6624 domain-containing protein [Chryseosolibacter sp.]